MLDPRLLRSSEVPPQSADHGLESRDTPLATQVLLGVI
jgi:hypothetical protein